MRAIASFLVVAATACSARSGQGDAPPTSSSAVRVPAASAEPFTGLTTRGGDRKTTADGIPIVVAKPSAAQREGDVVWVRSAFKATDSLPEHEASDGESIYLVVDKGSSMLVRDGVVHEDVMKRYGIEKGGCGAARDGALILSGPAPTGRMQEVVHVDASGARTTSKRPELGQIVMRIDEKGKEKRFVVPRHFSTEERCRAWLAPDGRFALGLFEIVTYDGAKFSGKRQGLGWYTGRTVMGKVGGPRFCFSSCNATEAKETHPDTAKLVAALGDSYGEWIAYDDWVAGAANGRAVRMKVGGAVETIAGIPKSSMLAGAADLAFTKDGDLVIGLDYRFRRYVVWPRGQAKLSPIRYLAKGEVIAKASPTVLVRGLVSSMPDSDTFAVLLGKHIGVGTGGSTYEFPELRRSPDAHRKRFERAKKVLGKGSFVAAHEAVVDTKCGAYVRSPVGWENMQIHDWTPPKIPALSPAAVFKPKKCLPLTHVSAMPGDPDLILAISGGELHAAWLPPRLPLPPGKSHFHPKPPAPLPKVKPRPGTGWTRLGPVGSVAGVDAIPDPGADTQVVPYTWQAGGGAVVTVGKQTILLTRQGAVTLPPGTKPMAVGQHGELHVLGVKGSRLVECRPTCRILDPGPKQDIVAVVPRTEKVLVLGYADGRIGSYTPPAKGGKAVPPHPLVAAFDKLLKTKPKP